MPDLFENLINKYRQHYHIHHYDGASQVNTGRYLNYLVAESHEQDRNRLPTMMAMKLGIAPEMAPEMKQHSLSLDSGGLDLLHSMPMAESSSRKSSVGSLDSEELME